MAYGNNPLTGRPGPAPHPPRDGDKKQARQRVNVEVRTGRRPRPNTIPCVECGHIWKEGERRHEYDHYLGYGAAHHLHVEVVCTLCQRARSMRRGEIKLENLLRASSIHAESRSLLCRRKHAMSRGKDGHWRCYICRREWFKNYRRARRVDGKN